MMRGVFPSVLAVCITAAFVVFMVLAFQACERADSQRAACIHEGHNAVECREAFHL